MEYARNAGSLHARVVLETLAMSELGEVAVGLRTEYVLIVPSRHPNFAVMLMMGWLDTRHHLASRYCS
jgi:hypothetical protein